VLLLEQQGLHVRIGFRAVEYDEAIHHLAPMPSKADVDTNQLKAGALFRLPVVLRMLVTVPPLPLLDSARSPS